MGIWEVFGHFLKKFLIWDLETWFRCVKNGPFGPNFRAVFDPKSIFLKSFHWIHTKFDL